jgi:hypothetical protein
VKDELPSFTSMADAPLNAGSAAVQDLHGAYFPSPSPRLCSPSEFADLPTFRRVPATLFALAPMTAAAARFLFLTANPAWGQLGRLHQQLAALRDMEQRCHVRRRGSQLRYRLPFARGRYRPVHPREFPCSRRLQRCS